MVSQLEREWGSLQPAPGKPKMEAIITVTRQRLQVIDKIHLTLRLSVYISAIDDEVTARIAKASVAFSVCFCSVYIHFYVIKLDTNEH